MCFLCFLRMMRPSGQRFAGSTVIKLPDALRPARISDQRHSLVACEHTGPPRPYEWSVYPAETGCTGLPINRAERCAYGLDTAGRREITTESSAADASTTALMTNVLW